MKRLILSLMTVISFVLQPAVGYAATLHGMSYPYSASTIYNLARSNNSYKLTSLSRRDMDVTNQYGDTALCLAVRNHDKDAYNALLEAGANPNPNCMNALEPMRPIKAGLASMFTPKLGYLVGLIAVGGGVALASGGGGGSKTCPGYKKADCPEAYHINEICEEDMSYHKCTANTKNTPENCNVIVVNKDECTSCKPDYYRSGTDCIERTITENCEVFDDTDDACLICKDGYYLNYGSCLPGNIDNCTVYTSKNICATCETGYVLSVNQDACVLPIEHCNTYGTTGVCITCDSGYFPSQDQSTCVLEIEHCSIYENDGSCNSCMPDYAVTKYRDKCVPYIERCQIYDEDGTCDTCETGYTQSQDKSHCVLPITGCTVYNNDGECIECSSSYPILYEGKCYTNDTYCTDAKSYKQTACVQPQVKDYCELPNGELNESYWLCVDGQLNCKKSDQDTGLCIECNIGWYVEEGICYQQNVTNCNNDYYPNVNKCRTCKDLFYLDEYGQCPPITVNNCGHSITNENKCEQCNPSYYPDADGTLCKKISNCVNSEGYENTCTECSADYYLKEGTCLTELQYCTAIDHAQTEACAAWQDTEACQLPGGYVSTTYHKCVNKTILHCDQTNPDGSCAKCDPLYYVDNGGATCSPISSSDCSDSDGINNKCTTCNTDYYPDTSGMCQHQDVANCVHYVANTNECQQCDPKYYVTGSKTCEQIDSYNNCQTSGGIENKCTTCNDNGYKVNSAGQCEKITNCNLSNGKDACITCDGDNAYYVDGGNCTQNTECAKTNGQTSECTSCATDYYLDGGHCYTEEVYCANKGTGRNVTTNPCEAYQSVEMCRFPNGDYSETYGRCIMGPYIENCIVVDEDESSPTVGKCLQCRTSGSGAYIITDGGASCTKIENCTVSNGIDSCTTCNTNGYYVNAGGTCSHHEHCTETDGTLNAPCTQCEMNTGVGYYISGGECTEISNCVKSQTGHSSTPDCERCSNHYVLSDSGGECVLSPNCIQTNGVDTCEMCNSPYQPIGKYCYEEQEYCAILPEQYTKTSCVSSSEYPEFCPWPGGDSTYRRCENGGIDGCVEYNQNPGHPNECTECDTGYYLNGTTCSVQTPQFGCQIYKTDALGCQTCYEGFTNNGGTCVRNSNYVNAEDYQYRVSNYDRSNPDTHQTRTEPVVNIVSGNLGVDQYSDATIIGFTSAGGYGVEKIAEQDGHSSDTYWGVSKYTEYDVHNTSYVDTGDTLTSAISLDGDQIALKGEIINGSTYSGKLIGLSSPGTADINGYFTFSGNASVYNAAGWNYPTNRTGTIYIDYRPAQIGGSFYGFTVYGIMSANRAYNAYANITGTLTQYVEGDITITSMNATDNYGIYATKNAYNAYGKFAKGYINFMSINSAAHFIGIRSDANAYNAAHSGHGEIMATNTEAGSSIDNKVIGMQVSSGKAYNAYDEDAYCTEGTIRLLSTDSTAMQATNGGQLYNSSGFKSATSPTTGNIELPYGGTAFETAGNAYNAYYGSGYVTIGDQTTGWDQKYTVCRNCSYFYNGLGQGSYGIINIYGNVDTIANFINSSRVEGDSKDGNGIVNIYTGAPIASLTNSTLNVITGGIGNVSSNGDNGHIKIVLGSGWNSNDTYNVNPLNWIPLTGESTITITNKQGSILDHNAKAKEIIGVKDSYMSGTSEITIATDWSDSYDTAHPLSYLISARLIVGIQNPTLDITGGTIKIQAALSGETSFTGGRAYGIYDTVSHDDLYTSSAKVNMQIWGGGQTGSNGYAYGLYNINNGENGEIYMDSYSVGGEVLDNMVGMYNSYGRMENAGDIVIGKNHTTNDYTASGYVKNSITGMWGRSVGEMTNSGNITLNAARYSNVIGMNADSISSSGDVTNSGTITITAGSLNAMYHSSSVLYGIYSHGSPSDIFNSGTINISSRYSYDTDLNRGNIYGIFTENTSSTSANATNTGAINITINQESTIQSIYGMDAVGNAYLYNGTESDHSNAIININATERVKNIYGMFVAAGAEAQNYGTINITATDAMGYVFGMVADDASTIKNYGLITVDISGGGSVSLAGGLMAVNGSTVINGSYGEGMDKHIGHIVVKNLYQQDSYSSEITNTTKESTIPPFDFIKYDETGAYTLSSAIIIDDTSQIINEGVISSQTAVNITGGGRMLMSRGSNLRAPSVTGTLTLASDIVTEGNEDVYTTTNLVTGNSDNVTVESASAMFTASTVVNAEDENSVDGVLTRRSFDTMVQSAALANYLEDNYTGNNAQEFFATLKTASNASEFDEILSKELGLCLMPNFAQENFNVFRSLGNLITDNLFSKDMTQERMMVGYDYLALSRDTKKHVTGYENTSNSSYFLGDIALNKYSRFGLGLSITKFNSDYDDDSDRDEMFAQLLASYMYDFGNKWRYAGVLHSGYGWGDYTRKLSHGDVDGNLHDFIYGLQNEFRYGIETPYVTLEPQVEMNFTGYYQRRINEENKNGSIIMKGTNNFSAESGIGLYASKEFDLEKYGRFKGRVGGSYYHEWAHPYGSIKARMRGTDGWYKIESDDIFERDRFMISADVTYTYKMFDLYVRGSQYFEKDTVAVFNAGLKYNF